MIGTHDSMTYIRARFRVCEWFSWFWRTQTKTISEQREAGVGYLDIRVRRVKDGWRLCHGLVDLGGRFRYLSDLLYKLKDFRIRLILERGRSKEFEQEAAGLPGRYPNISFLGIKKGWRVLYDRDPRIVDFSFVPWYSGRSAWWNLRNLWGKLRRGDSLTIRGHSRLNPEITQEMREDEETCWFMDMI